MIRSLLLCSILALAASIASAETTYYVKGETFENIDSPGGPGSEPFVPSPVTGILIGDDLDGSLTGSLFVGGDVPSGGESFPIAAALAAAPTSAIPLLGVPALATVASPGTVSSPDGLSVWAGSFIDFERPLSATFSMETLTGWDMLLAVFGAGPGQEDVRFGAILQLSETPFVEVPNPSTFVLGLLALCGFVGYGAFVSIDPKLSH